MKKTLERHSLSADSSQVLSNWYIKTILDLFNGSTNNRYLRQLFFTIETWVLFHEYYKVFVIIQFLHYKGLYLLKQQII